MIDYKIAWLCKTEQNYIVMHEYKINNIKASIASNFGEWLINLGINDDVLLNEMGLKLCFRPHIYISKPD